MSNHRGSRGQATPLWAIVLGRAALLLGPVALLGRATIERAEAQSAADAAALAAALADDGDGEADAREIASRNGARLESYARDGNTFEVTVVVGNRRATARATREVVRTQRADDPP